MRIETLLVNGRLLTMDPARPEAAALAVAGGRIVAVGARDELLGQRDHDTEVIDLGGRFACPGFVDPHNHFGMNALAPAEADCRTPPLTSIAAIQERIRERALTQPAGTWLRGHGYDEDALRERRHPTRAELDEAAPEHPVVLVHWSVHRCVLNSAALAALGIGPDTPDPPAGWIVRDPDGLPAGPLYETATNAPQSRSLAAYAERLVAQAPELFETNARRYLAAGITAVGDAYVSPPLRRLYQAAGAAGRLPLGVSAYCGGIDGLFSPPRQCLNEALHAEGTLRRVGVKIFVDGGGNTTATSLTPGPPSRSAGIPLSPATGAPACRIGRALNGRGERSSGTDPKRQAPLPFRGGAGGEVRPSRLFYSQSNLDDLVAAAHRRGMQVAVHAAGDIAVRMTLTAMERARAAQPRVEPRFRIEHGVLLDDELIRRLRDVGAVLVAQPLSVYYHADKIAAAPLAEGLRYVHLRDLLDAGVTVAAGSDSPCYPLDPLLHVWAALTRRTRAGTVHDSNQRLTVEEALRMATLNAARATFTADEEGSLSRGKRANLVVLSADPRGVPPDELGRVRVEATYRDGRLAYDRARDGEVPAVGRLLG